MLSLPLLVGALLVAGSASAITTYYDVTGSFMSMVNQVCNPCTVPVTGYFVLDDDLGGNVTLTNMNLAHIPYEVASPFAGLSVILDRDSISVSGTAAGLGTTVGGNTVFGPALLAQIGTATCTPLGFPCIFAGLPTGVSPLTPGVSVNLGSWAFDLLGNLTSAPIIYTNNPGQAVETLNLFGTPVPVPEPGTAVLMMAGLVGIAMRRRAGL